MTLEFSVKPRRGGDATSSSEDNACFVFIADDLPAVCVILLREMDGYDRGLLDPTLRFIVNPDVGTSSRVFENGWPYPDNKLRRVLELLREVRGMAIVEIEGPGHPSYKDDIIATMCGRRRSETETMEEIAVFYDRGDEAVNNNDYESAIAEYKAALHTINGRAFDEHEYNTTLIGGRFDGLLAGWATDDCFIRLHTSIAACYLRAKMYRMARIYVERIYGPLHCCDHRFNKLKFPLSIESDNKSMPSFLW